ncbi:MAG: tRNA 4-thiouridine(8) synthase ThiI [Firmicutes bacterium]|nr:tRNA 4-thiouridine(8) synthase ThiI [Bacillota bacterium]
MTKKKAQVNTAKAQKNASVAQKDTTMPDIVVLIRYAELFLKGKNRDFFIDTLVKNIKAGLLGCDISADLKKEQGRIILQNFATQKDIKAQENKDLEALKNLLAGALSKIFGISSYSFAYKLAIGECLQGVSEFAVFRLKEMLASGRDVEQSKMASTFKVTTTRADKKFPHNSDVISGSVGAYILKELPHLKVNLSSPELVVHLEIRERGLAYVYFKKIEAGGGLPIGTSGKALSLLSGGIDSPVASYKMAKRGLQVDFIHFHSYPHTSKQAKDKVIDLANIVKGYTGGRYLYMVNILDIQKAIDAHCNNAYAVVLARRVMMQIANAVADKFGYLALITGESLGQVASQTVESIAATNEVAKTPVLRPLIALDKLEIINIAKRINTYATSILPYEDTCTAFVPRSPITKPKLEKVLKEESKLNCTNLKSTGQDIQALIKKALENIEAIKI